VAAAVAVTSTVAVRYPREIVAWRAISPKQSCTYSDARSLEFRSAQPVCAVALLAGVYALVSMGEAIQQSEALVQSLRLAQVLFVLDGPTRSRTIFLWLISSVFRREVDGQACLSACG